MSEVSVENVPRTPWVVVPLLAGSVLASSGGQFPTDLYVKGGSVIGVTLELENRSAIVGPLPAELDYALDSPDFVPQQLRDFAARGFERRNRWS